MGLGKWIGLIVFCLSLYVLWQIKQVVLLGFTAIVIASALNGLVRQMTKVNIKRPVAIALAMLGLLSLTIIILLLVIPPFIAESKQLLEIFPQVIERIQDGINWLQNQRRLRSGRVFLGVGVHLYIAYAVVVIFWS